MEKKLDFDDLFGLWQPHWWESPWKVLAVGLFCILFVVVVRWVIKKYWSQPRVIDPRLQALQKLYALNPEHLPVPKDFYVQLLAVMRGYLDVRYGLMSRSKTEHELVDYLKLHHCPPDWILAAEKVLAHGFLIKFAQGQADKNDLSGDYALVHDLLVKEKSVEVVTGSR